MKNKVKTITLFTLFEKEYRTNIQFVINANGSIQNSGRIIKSKRYTTEKEKKQRKIWRKKNKEKIKKYNKDNKERANINKKQDRKNYPEKYKIWASNKYSKRKEWGKPKPINEIFKDSELHHFHINNSQDCIYIPKELHNSIKHYNKDKKSMNKINKVVFEWLLKQ